MNKKVQLGDPITPMELAVWKRLTATGECAKELAKHFNVSYKTTEVHIERLIKKVGVKSGRQLIVEGWKNSIHKTEDTPVIFALQVLKTELDKINSRIDILLEVENTKCSQVQVK